ncbi:hypothetical protein FOL47_005999 [Perkinsus chesapeaki]|uniref:Aminotransferase class V domain-containing protein n=1 Tax=Perkinsus chesapeaki TaxID=330153 RepID=A0A7J6LV90_PERCH|nr:hypothetical protein FOL47_005999 [Perkinsus chesapeaki]
MSLRSRSRKVSVAALVAWAMLATLSMNYLFLSPPNAKVTSRSSIVGQPSHRGSLRATSLNSGGCRWRYSLSALGFIALLGVAARAALRKAFPYFDDQELTYLDSAATSHKPQVVIDAMDDFYCNTNSNVHRSAHVAAERATEALENSRETMARFIGADGIGGLVITSGATDGLNRLAGMASRNGLLKDGKVLITEMDHHSNILPWSTACERTQMVKVDPLTGEIDMEDLSRKLDKEVKIVAFVHVSHVTGHEADVEGIRRLVRSKAPNALIVLDCTQSVPHQKIDVDELGVDAIVFSAHKMFGPTGVGVLWLSDRALRELPLPATNGGGSLEDIDCDTLKIRYTPPPWRYEPGTPPLAEAVGMARAADFVMDHRNEIKQHEDELLSLTLDEVSKIPCNILGGDEASRGAPIVSMTFNGVYPNDVGTIASGLRGVCVRAGHHCAIPFHRAMGEEGSLRLSLGPYNTSEDVKKGVDAIAEALDIISDENH